MSKPQFEISLETPKIIGPTLAMVMQLPSLPCGIYPNVGAVIHSLKFGSKMGFQNIILKGPLLSFLQPVSPVSLEFSVQDIWLEEIEVLHQQFSSFFCLEGG
jgi:hypothetical protein